MNTFRKKKVIYEYFPRAFYLVCSEAEHSVFLFSLFLIHIKFYNKSYILLYVSTIRHYREDTMGSERP